MERKHVRSSDIASIGYNRSSSVLEIEFLSGGIYQYMNVPEDIFRGIMSASSHGTYFHQHITKGKFEFREKR